VTWDAYAEATARDAVPHDWMEDNAKSSLNDGAPTRSARFNQGSGFSTPDITIIPSGRADKRQIWNAEKSPFWIFLIRSLYVFST